MSDLGVNQTVTKVSKEMNGSGKLIGALVLGGCAIGAAIFGPIGAMIGAKREKAKQKIASSEVYSVVRNGSSKDGLLFNVGDTFRVLKKNGDDVLIETSGSLHNPHYVSADLLRSVSNYRG